MFSRSNKYQLVPNENDLELKERSSDANEHWSYDENENEFLESPIDRIISKDEKKNADKNRRNTRMKRFFFLVCFLLIMWLVGVFFLGINKFTLSYWRPYLGKFLGNAAETNQVDWKEWSVKMDAIGTESCVKLLDVDNDGLDDIIFGAAGMNEINRLTTENSTEEEKHKAIKVKCGGEEISKGCAGIVIAMRGYDGKVLYKFSTKSEIFELNCNSIDVNLDGKKDCIGTGRIPTFIAFDPRNGQIFWDASFGHEMHENWNIYMPIVLPYDLDHDGVYEIIISHGGNPMFPAEDHNREPGLIMLYSGRTGKLMGECLVLPENKETYMSPVLHIQKDGSAYILIGSGGETVNGHLHIISLPDFYNHVMKDFLMLDNFKQPKFRGNYKNNFKSRLSSVNYLPTLYSLIETKTKGVMVPPVLVDVNKDGTRDILILTFDGAVLLYDGQTFEKLWEKYYKCHETYTTPAPAYFNDDDIPDFMLTQNYGTFDYYKNSTILILDGRDGSVLWSMTTPRMQMASPLVVQTEAKNRDLYFFRAQGIEVNAKKSNTVHQVFHGIEPQQPINQEKSQNYYQQCERLTFDTDREKTNTSHLINAPRCENRELNEKYLSSFGLIVDRSVQKSPVILFRSKPENFVYNYTEYEMEVMKVGPGNGSVCVVMEAMERNTGAIGYLTNKHDLDVVTIFSRSAMIKDEYGNFNKLITDIVISKNSLGKSLLHQNEKIDQEIYDMVITKYLPIDENEKLDLIQDLKFKEKQEWNSYLGLNSDSSI